MNHAFLHVGKDDVETSQVSCCYIAIYCTVTSRISLSQMHR